MQNITFDNFDKFQRKPFADKLTKVISTFYPFENEAFVLSLNAKFGSGKSTFLHMWKNDLQNQGYKVILINAWETDFDEEPLVPIIGAFLDNIKGNGTEKAKNALRASLGTIALVGNKYLETKIGMDAHSICKEVESDIKSSDLRKIGNGLYKSYSFKQKAYAELKIVLSDYVKQLDTQPLIILVDELDRVRPDYSVKFLEAIKHIFAVQGVCFVLAVDIDQLKSSVQQLYGKIDFYNYYRRFITREASLPSSNQVQITPFIEQQAITYFDEKEAIGIHCPFKNKNDRIRVLNHLGNVCRAFNMTPRQIEYLFRIFSQFLAISDENKTGKESWMRASVFLIATFIMKEELYHNIGRNSVAPKEINDFIEKLDFTWDERGYQKKYILQDAMAFSLSSENKSYHEEIKNIMSNDKSKTSTDESLNILAKTVDEWGDIRSKSGFQEIYGLLESWRSFIE